MISLQNKSSYRRLILHGNSLFANLEGNVNYGKRVMQRLNTQIVNNDKRIALFDYSIPGRRTPDMPTDYATWGSMVRPNDIVVVWELTNDLNANVATAQEAYDNMNDYALTLRNAGAYVVGLTCIARDSSGLSANFETRRTDCNALLLASSNFHEIVDVAALPEFDAVADCSNATYYNADKVHLTQTGYELIADNIYDQLASKI